MRRVKKTTIEQFDLLKSEMAVHPAAARGYAVGANRAVVDAEWKEIVEKLNALGPPFRTMTEWKKVWSDYRLRNLKLLSKELLPKAKKVKYKTKKNKVLETLNSFDTIPYSEETEENKPCLAILNSQEESNHHNTEESYQQDPFKDEEHNSSKEQFFNSSIHSLEEHEDFYPINPNNYKSHCPPANDSMPSSSFSDGNLNYLGEILTGIEHQIKNQNSMMENLSKITSNLAQLMERHVTNLEKQNQIMERKLRITECNNLFLRRQEARRKPHHSTTFNCKRFEYQKL